MTGYSKFICPVCGAEWRSTYFPQVDKIHYHSYCGCEKTIKEYIDAYKNDPECVSFSFNLNNIEAWIKLTQAFTQISKI